MYCLEFQIVGVSVAHQAEVSLDILLDCSVLIVVIDSFDHVLIHVRLNHFTLRVRLLLHL